MRCLRIAALALLLAGCAGIAPKKQSIENVRAYQHPFDQVWTSVMEAFAASNVPITQIEKASGFISTDKLPFPSNCADCGATPIGVPFNDVLRGSFNVFVKVAPDSTCEVRVTASYFSPTTNPFYRGCFSTGYFERKILNLIGEGLGDAPIEPASGENGADAPASRSTGSIWRQ